MTIPAKISSGVMAIAFGFCLMPSGNAHAAVPPTATAVIGALQLAYAVFADYRDQDITLDEATDEMLAAIAGAKSEILSRVEGLASSEAIACAKSTIINFQNIEAMTPSVKQTFALQSVYCLSYLDNLLQEVEDDAAVDKLGFALNALGPVALLAHEHADLATPDELVDILLSGNVAVIQKLLPPCKIVILQGDAGPGQPAEKQVSCKAYNGDTGFQASWTTDPNFAKKRALAEDRATRNTSRALAKALLPQLGALQGAVAGPVRLNPGTIVLTRWR